MYIIWAWNLFRLGVNLHTCHSKRAQEQPKTKYEPGQLITVIMLLKKSIIYLSQL